jgi:2-polyprenyl-3-methyl-5-hydroxy-6-metoxy-1,4-benzoquinol methylase
VKYRDILYQNYSQHFERPSQAEDVVHFAIFDSIYPAPEAEKGIVVDLACGRGSWLRWMQSRGAHELVGVDLSQFDLDAVGLPQAALVHQDLFSFLRGEKRQFSLIHAKDVIEHLTKDEVVDFLSLCRERLVPGGSLWISTFNALAPMAAQTWRGDFTHEMAFTPASMQQVMRACGFAEVEVRCCHPVPPTLNGRIRRWLLKPITALCQFTAHLRYGYSKDLNCLPTLLAFGKTSR